MSKAHDIDREQRIFLTKKIVTVLLQELQPVMPPEMYAIIFSGTHERENPDFKALMAQRKQELIAWAGNATCDDVKEIDLLAEALDNAMSVFGSTTNLIASVHSMTHMISGLSLIISAPDDAGDPPATSDE